MKHRRTRARDARGMVTVELAVATLAALALLTLMAWGIYLIVMQLRCIDTAAAVARQEARGDDSAVASARASAPTGARVAVRRTTTAVTVTVTLTARPLGDWLVSVPLSAQARVVPEPGGDQ